MISHVIRYMYMYTCHGLHTHVHYILLIPIIAHPEVSLAISQYRQRSMSATYQRPAPVREGEGPHFGRTYPNVNESFFSLPTVTTTDLAALSRKARPNFVHLIHSNSAPMVMTEDGEGGRGRDHTARGGFGENQNEGTLEWEWAHEQCI